jgi:hypothetical protein
MHVSDTHAEYGDSPPESKSELCWTKPHLSHVLRRAVAK